MTLGDMIQLICQRVHDATPHTDAVIGTVTSTSPLTVSLGPNFPPVTSNQLLLTEAVLERNISFSHTHSLNNHTHAGGTLANSSGTLTGTSAVPSTANTDTGTLVNNVFNSTPAFSQYEAGWGTGKDGANCCMINAPLAQGDKVLMLQVSGGQQFIILSRIIPSAG